jgi:hypothetical protein
MLRLSGCTTIIDFNNGYSLFLMGFLYTSEQLRNMEQDYGIIPSPKFE